MLLPLWSWLTHLPVMRGCAPPPHTATLRGPTGLLVFGVTMCYNPKTLPPPCRGRHRSLDIALQYRAEGLDGAVLAQDTCIYAMSVLGD